MPVLWQHSLSIHTHLFYYLLDSWVSIGCVCMPWHNTCFPASKTSHKTQPASHGHYKAYAVNSKPKCLATALSHCTFCLLIKEFKNGLWRKLKDEFESENIRAYKSWAPQLWGGEAEQRLDRKVDQVIWVGVRAGASAGQLSGQVNALESQLCLLHSYHILGVFTFWSQAAL